LRPKWTALEDEILRKLLAEYFDYKIGKRHTNVKENGFKYPESSS
jgi:hypothetical protein